MSGAQTELHGNAVLRREEKQYLGRVSRGRDYMLVIEPGRAERHYWHDLWRYRELFRVLAWHHGQKWPDERPRRPDHRLLVA